jgi:hypothetical protein
MGVVLESILEFVLEYALQYVLKSIVLEKIMVSRNFRQTHLLEVGLTQILVDHSPLSIVRHVGLHVDFSSINLFWGALGLHLLV